MSGREQREIVRAGRIPVTPWCQSGMFWHWVTSAEKAFGVALLRPIHCVAKGILVGANTGVVRSTAIVG